MYNNMSTFEDDGSNGPWNLERNAGLFITLDSVRTAIKGMRNGKTAGPDNFYTEFLKFLNDRGIKWLSSIFNSFYNYREIPQICEKIRRLQNYYFKSHQSKIFLKMIHK